MIPTVITASMRDIARGQLIWSTDSVDLGRLVGFSPSFPEVCLTVDVALACDQRA